MEAILDADKAKSDVSPLGGSSVGMRAHYGVLIGESASFLRAVQSIPVFTQSAATTLISGDTGTGKEVFARAIHYHSLRQSKPFVPINCAALPDHLFENELFGHSKGAFTDASTEQRGLLGEAEGGTLFLDEINSLNQSAQAKLLRLLQDKEYRPLGCSKARRADVRIIAATNADLHQKVEEGSFRRDLYYRLKVLHLHLPSLKERKEDIPLLVSHFVNQYTATYNRSGLQVSNDALEKLQAYDWPGNVRELEGIIHQAVLFCVSQRVITEREIDLPDVKLTSYPENSTLRVRKASTIEQFERAYLSDLLIEHGGNISRAAKQAGKERRSFQRLLKKYGLDGSLFRKQANVLEVSPTT
jgi:transcriptional regulator with PAS, ATPase and Fis domain